MYRHHYNRSKEYCAVGILGFSLYMVLSIFLPNFSGAIGRSISDNLIRWWGYAAITVPASLIIFSCVLFCKDSKCWFRGLGIIIVVICVDTLASMVLESGFGLVGKETAKFLISIVGSIGAAILLATTLAIIIQYLFNFSWTGLILKYKLSRSKTEYKPTLTTEFDIYNRAYEKNNTDVCLLNSDPLNIVNSNQNLLEKCLTNFDIVGARLVESVKGPVITRHYVSLPPGIRSSKVTCLDKDIARSLSVLSCRVIENIAGRSEIAIELPNDIKESVDFHSIVHSKNYMESNSAIPVPMGKNTTGMPVILDLATMPHLLVAGTTGSGKSTFLLSMICAMISEFAPSDLSLILIDPKMLTFSSFSGIGHLLLPPVTDKDEATGVFTWCLREMDRRYKILLDAGVSDISQYSGNSKSECLSRIVIVIDEYADLIFGNKDIEDFIIQIAQKARSCGIHLILATQRPSSDVITGLIKANIPTRIAFKTASKLDSRIILDEPGADQLLGHGDMLVSHNGEVHRIHGAYIDQHDIENIVGSIRLKYGEPSITNIEFQQETRNQDDLFEAALEEIKKAGKASIRLLQRQLGLGHTRASRIIGQLEKEGYISAPNKENVRDLLM